MNKRNCIRNAAALLPAVVLIGGGAFQAYADYPATVLANGPIAYWRLNETAQPPAGDTAVNSGSLAAAANGYYVAGATHPEPGALVGQTSDTAASFTGGARVAIPYQAGLNPSGPFTVECWAYKDPGTGYPLGVFSALQYVGGAERRGWLIYDNDANWQFRLGDGAGYIATTQGGTANVGEWYHLVGVFDGANAILYVNGVAVSTVAISRPFEANPSWATEIGTAGAFGRHFSGIVDEPAIYPTALSAAEILAHYQNAINPAPTTPYSQLVQGQNPLGYWRLNEPAYQEPGTLPTAANLGSAGAAASGSYHPGVQAGVAGSTYSGFGADNKAAGFNGLAGHVGTQASLDNLAQFTVMGWLKRDAAHSARGGYFGQNDLLEFGDAGGGTTIEAWINAYNSNIIVPYPFPDDQWGFIALVGDGTKAVLYTNGIPAATRSGTVASYGSSAYKFNIGGGGIFNATGDFFLGSIDEVAVFNKALSAQQILDLFASANVPPWITRQPVAPARAVHVGNTVTLSVEAAGPAPLTYQWRKGDQALTGATSPSLSFTGITTDDSGTYEVVVSNTYGSVTSATVTLDVQPAETTPPTILYATGSESFNRVRVWFSEPLDPASAQLASNYQLSGGLTVSSATLGAPAGNDGDHIVDLVTSAQAPGQMYTLTVTGVKDQVSPANTIAAGSTVDFSSWVLFGGLKFEVWNGLSTSDNNIVNTLLADPRFPDSPDWVTVTTALDSRVVYPDDSHEGYGGKMSGYIIPTETADYRFFLRSDDSSRLYLSTTADPADAVLIAEETDCCDPFVDYTVANDDGVTYATSDPAVNLVAGQRYYIEVIWKEGGGGDYCQVAWRKETDSTLPGNLTPIQAQHLGTYMDPNVDLAFVSQPTDQLGVVPSAGIQFYSQDFNASNGGYTVENTDPVPPGPWVYDSASGKWVADGAESGCTGPYDSKLNSPGITLTQAGIVALSFSHRYSFEPDLWDAGLVRISVNGGEFALVPAQNFTANGYAEGAIVGNGIALGLRGFNGDSPGYSAGQFITSKALLGKFKQNDTLVVQFVGAWDDCSSGSVPGWVIDGVQLEIVPMTIQEFTGSNGGFTVEDSATPPPGAWGPWTYSATEGQWAANGADAECGGPFNSKLVSPPYTVPMTEEVTLSFTHRYSFEGDLWDGGQVRISVNGGEFSPVPAGSFTANGYAAGNIQGTGILNGQRGFNGDSPGYASATFITSSAVLGAFNQNDTIRVQFVGAWDECSGGSQPSWVVKSLELLFGQAAQASTFAAEAVATLQGEPVPVTYQWQRNDGANWVNIAGADDPSLTLYPNTADFNARFRVVASALPNQSLISNEVKLVTEVVAEPEIAFSWSGNALTITFVGTLQSATSINGTYSNVGGAVSPYVISNPAGTRFFRSSSGQ
jgi:hypothetical protein